MRCPVSASSSATVSAAMTVSRVADLAELAAQLVDAPVEVAGELHQMVFLAILAGHAVTAGR